MNSMNCEIVHLSFEFIYLRCATSSVYTARSSRMSTCTTLTPICCGGAGRTPLSRGRRAEDDLSSSAVVNLAALERGAGPDGEKLDAGATRRDNVGRRVGGGPGET